MIYKFIDDQASFSVENPHRYNLYFPLTNRDGSLLSSISPNLAGDIKKDNDRFLTVPASIEDIRNNLLCRREFFIKKDKEVIRASFSANDKLEAGFLYHKIIKIASGLRLEILNFIPYDLAAEVMWVKVINKSRRAVKITPTSFIPLFGRSEKNLRDHRHVSSLLNRVYLDKYGILLKPTMIFDEKGHRENTDIYFTLGYEGNTAAPVGQFPTLDCFLGEGDIVSPDAVIKDLKPAAKKEDTFDGKEACAGFRFRDKKLDPGGEADYFLVMGIEGSRNKINAVFGKLNTPSKVKQSLRETKKYWQGYLSALDFDFGDRNYNGWLKWVKLQPTLRKLFGCSFLPHFDYGKGGRGWRDLWQDALALLLVEPEKAGDSIFNNFKGVRIDGSNATIITKDGDFIPDRNRISRVWMDHGVWPYLTLKLYLNKTGDLGFLLKEAGYFRDQQLERAKRIEPDFSQDGYSLRAKDNKIYKGTILEHLLVQNLIPFFNVGSHNIIRLENADWNDGLDMASQRGESAAFSFMYAHNLKDICGFLEALKTKTKSVAVLKELALLLDGRNGPLDYSNYKEKQKRLELYFEKTKRLSGEKVDIKIEDLIKDLNDKSAHLFDWLREKEWLKEGFFNGYYDNRGRRVEGKSGGKTKMMLQSQVFAIMSSGAAAGQIRRAWDSIKEHLQDKGLGGFRLNTDFGSICMDFGRAFGFSYGDKENGAFFDHMVVMLANALYKRGFSKEGFEAIDSIYKMAVSEKGMIYPVMPEYFNGQGRGLYLYLTGSASWYIYTLMEEVLGIKFFLGDMRIEPKLIPENFFDKEIRLDFSNLGKRISVVFIKGKKENKACTIKELFLNGKEIPSFNCGYTIKRDSLKAKENIIKAHLA
ncbi:MAG: cellobiose phosphorylase [Candidatus Omnitrophica bacterium]|nr:cellobiose phosphorylase [Candidatus Omnitrophota bacterium]